jgi:hypothetical protein
MRFHPHSIEVAGTESWREGEYTNERNTTQEIVVSERQAEEILDDLEAALTESLK